MHIKYVDGHYEIVSADNGQFIQSADTWDEALDDMKELLTTTVQRANRLVYITFFYYKGDQYYEGNC